MKKSSTVCPDRPLAPTPFGLLCAVEARCCPAHATLLFAGSLALAVTVAPSRAHAFQAPAPAPAPSQTPSAPPVLNSPVPVTTSSREGPRFRFGIGTHGGFLRIESVTPLGAGLGIYARVGVQINDRFAVDVQASGATIVVGGYGRLNAFFDVTLADRLSVAVGPLFAAGFGNSNAAMLGGTLRLGVHAPRNRYASGVRSSMNWGVEADLGAAFYFRSLLGPFSGGLTFFLGYQRD